MTKAEDLIGRKFGRLTVTTYLMSRPGRTRWGCLCECGTEVEVLAEKLKSRKTQSCGCLRKEVSSERGRANTRHGLKGSLTWNSWSSMIARGRKSHGPYQGISVHPRWHRFEDFLADMGERPSRLHSIDRYPDNAGNYEPGNCRWATKAEQANNRKDNR